MVDKRALIITRNFPPITGGMEKLVWNLYNELKSDYLCSVIGPSGCKKYVSARDCSLESPVSSIYMFLFIAFIEGVFCSAVRRNSICIAGSGVTAPIAVAIKKMFNVPAVVLIHGLDLIVDNRIYQRYFVPAVLNADIVIVNSQNTARLALAKGVLKDKIKVLSPGVKLPHRPYTKNNFRKRYGVEDKKLLLSVGRLIPRKGIFEFLKFSLPEILDRCPKTVYMIIGEEPRESLKKTGNYIQKIKSIIHEKGLTKHVLLLGHVDEMTLAQAYHESDLHILPVRDIPGDIEGFGMVIIEAASYGLPTVSFSVGGVPDAIRHQYSGLLVEKDNYRVLSETIINHLNGKAWDITAANCINHAKQFSWERYGIRLREICDQVIG
ncbi:glycosyltransferase family 4 protein [Deltaproteobacteria bacterium]|nr:glycosyltransferase family 4 protein [Deltaproteobacteria bacterium]